jgi:hypothetical protein
MPPPPRRRPRIALGDDDSRRLHCPRFSVLQRHHRQVSIEATRHLPPIWWPHGGRMAGVHRFPLTIWTSQRQVRALPTRAMWFSVGERPEGPPPAFRWISVDGTIRFFTQYHPFQRRSRLRPICSRPGRFPTLPRRNTAAVGALRRHAGNRYRRGPLKFYETHEDAYDYLVRRRAPSPSSPVRS